jgi:rod shape-determining protein MreB
LTGGGALIKGLDKILEECLKISVIVDDDPLTAVARGTGVILENFEEYRDVLIENEDDLPPKK